MLLSDRGIKAAIEPGRVMIDPCGPELVQPSSVDVRPGPARPRPVQVDLNF